MKKKKIPLEEKNLIDLFLDRGLTEKNLAGLTLKAYKTDLIDFVIFINKLSKSLINFQNNDFAKYVDYDLIKIGWSHNPESRIITLSEKYCTEIELIDSFPVLSAYYIEQSIHRLLKDFRTNAVTISGATLTEAFDLKKVDIPKLIERIKILLPRYSITSLHYFDLFLDIIPIKDMVREKSVKEIHGNNSQKSYSLKEKREKYKNAYMPWSQDDDTTLQNLFLDGTYKIRDLAEIFGRNNGAIRSRLKKLGLLD